ncbi:MAG: serine hydrolase [Hyphomicrobiales bacterium]|nr:serine hydrolase [Hyphomicrobiales bacterium]
MASLRTSKLTFEELFGGTRPTGLVDNAAFMPPDNADLPHQEFAYRLTLAETEMASDKVMLSQRRYHNLRADLFPGVDVPLVSRDGELIPLERDLIRAPDGDSYWDITVSPGKVWSVPGDRGFSRGVFAFELSNVLENDTHHGLASFVYDDTGISPVRFQIAVETKNFVIPETFDASGNIDAGVHPLTGGQAEAAIAAYAGEVADQWPLRAWSDLPGAIPNTLLNDVTKGACSDTEIVSGLVIDGEIYATPCRTRAGGFPLPRGMKFGIWSATKTAFGTMACLRLAQITGEDPRRALIADLIPEAEGLDRWSQITIGHCLNMASGIGTAAPFREATDILSDYILDEKDAAASDLAQLSRDHYFDWFLAYSQTEKNHAALACDAYPWGPDEVARYRDQDLYMAGAAMDAWYKQRCGSDKRLWHLVRDEVYRPARIHHAVKFETIEDDPARIVPLTDAGLLLTMDNIARLGQLIHDGGKVEGEQLLQPDMLAEVFDPRHKKGLRTGIPTADGIAHYHTGTWHMPFMSSGSDEYWLPTMVGYGGQMIQILPNGMTAFRFGHDRVEIDTSYDFLRLARIADAIKPF